AAGFPIVQIPKDDARPTGHVGLDQQELATREKRGVRSEYRRGQRQRADFSGDCIKQPMAAIALTSRTKIDPSAIVRRLIERHALPRFDGLGKTLAGETIPDAEFAESA